MELSTIIGIIAATCTTFSFVPQVIKILRTNDTSGISLGMYAIFVIGIGLWLVYGIMLYNLPIIIANSITIVLAGTVLLFKIRNG